MLIWDLLAVLFVLLPVLTGGITWQAPHVHLEYTEVGVPVLLLALWLWYHKDAERSRVCRFARTLWWQWCAGLIRRPGIFLGAAWLAASLVSFLTSWLRHRGFGSGLADLGIFTNAISNVAELGYPMSSLKFGLSLLTDHQIFLLYPLGWLFPLWPSPVFLLLLQALVLASGGVALYFLGRQRLGAVHVVVPFLPFLYWLAGPLRAAARFDFHPETFMLPLFLFAAYFLQEPSWRKRAAGAVFLLTALAAKESAGPVACGLGLAWFLGAGPEHTRPFTRILGAATVALGAGVFVFDEKIVPALFGVTYAYSDLYAPLPASVTGLALAAFTQPLTFFGRLFSLSRLKFFAGSLLPEGFLPLLTPAAVASLPGFLMLFLTGGDHRISLGYHYAIEPMTGLLFALPAALDTAFAHARERWLLPLLVLASAVSYGRSDPFYWRAYQPNAHQAWLRDEVLPRVPHDRSVSASYGIVPHLAARRWVDQPRTLTFTYAGKTQAYDCFLFDPGVNNMPMTNEQLEAVIKEAKDIGFVEELRCGTLTVLHAPHLASCLSSPPPPCPAN